MTDELFVFSLGVPLASLVHWAVKRLPDERWQFLASIPIMKDASGRWHGLNVTYYGLLTANALAFGVALLILLFGALHVSMAAAVSVILTVLLICLPAAKWVARLVEGKRCTFTIAGAFFVGIFVAPAVLYGFDGLLPSLGLRPIPVMPALAAALIAYAFGEGLGRLACISFGCCYGALLSESHPLLQRLFNQWHFIFSGKMKKISYASAMDGKRVIPIQAVTAVIYLSVGLISLLLFFHSEYTVAFLLAMIVTQGWRVLSETLRADYRGEGKTSAYQVMGLLAILFALAMSVFARGDLSPKPELAAGLEIIWHPVTVILLQALWVVVFVMFGKSMVTESEISFHLRPDRI
ncbi:MAG TPA: hypothetical protein VLX11_04670 [Candidatus Acidoferrales bacterium]|nr:hypothetical protein [Candidatus Acidoferrales bacterium]